MSRSLAAALPFLLAACSGAALERAPANPLERGIVLREAAEDGWHGVSSEDPAVGRVQRVLEPAPVDAESRVELRPDAEALREAALERGLDPARARLRLEAFLQRAGAEPAPLHLPGYDRLDEKRLAATPQPLLAAPPTALGLTDTIAREGDRVLLRTILEDEHGVASGAAAESRLRLTQLGWHSTYHPSVVLARPGSASGNEAEFRFTPGVSWLHAYEPRADERGALADWMRSTQMSIGPHALLLQFDTEDEVEVGLGVTAGFWGGVLQVGVGYNLMADGGQGRHYFYLGSSMIALAQAGQRTFGAFGAF